MYLEYAPTVCTPLRRYGKLDNSLDGIVRAKTDGFILALQNPKIFVIFEV